VDALGRYRQEHKTLPARVALYKTSPFDEAELAGFTAALDELAIDSADLISVGSGDARLFRRGAYPPLRGTYVALDERNVLVYTRGSVDFYRTYPGPYVPQPLAIRCDQTDLSPRELAEEVLALTKMNWNNTQFDGYWPITVRAAREVGNILKYVGTDEPVGARYAYYM
jgi:argonaute-like protein implicated in RNA metabolism and viral defense